MSNPVKIIIAVIILAIIGVGTGLGLNWYLKGKQKGEEPKFAWGVTILPFPFRTYREAFTGTQIAEAKKLGINYIRVDYPPNNPKAADTVIAAAEKNGLRVVLVIPFGPNDIFTDKDLTNSATKYVSDIATRYKGKVAVYQLATEVASVALGNNAAAHGIALKDYPGDKIGPVTTWLLAATKAIKTVDPAAKRLVNDQWVHIGFFDNFFAKGGDFDILGWNWFSDMGDDMTTVVIDPKKKEVYQLLSKLESYNKPIWLTEVNRRLGSNDGKEAAQAEFIAKMATYATQQNSISGFFVFNFVEDQAAPAAERGYGIVKAVEEGSNQRISGRKPAFEAYKNAIKAAR